MLKATNFSQELYYPMLLSNGKDGILIDYSGSNFCSYNGHTHSEQMLGASCGWYKAGTRSISGQVVAQIIKAGYQISIHGIISEPDNYAQWLDPQSGIFYSELTFFKELHIKVESFLTDEGLWCERIFVLKCPSEFQAKFGFRIFMPRSGYNGMEFASKPTIFAVADTKELGFTYQLASVKGKGSLIPAKPFDRIELKNNKEQGELYFCEGIYEHVAEDDVFTRVMICLDESECEDLEEAYASARKVALEGYEQIRESYIRSYKENVGISRITLPDERLQQLYDVSRYVIQGARNRQSGALLLGILPHLWGGGLYCSYDAYFIINALLSSGVRDAARGQQNFFISQAEIGHEVLCKAGLKGIAFTGWTDCNGRFARTGWDMAKWFLNEKPVFICNEIMNFYTAWKYAGRIKNLHVEEILKDTYLFIKTYLLCKKDGKYSLINVKSGDESGVDVETDTFTILALAQALYALADMLQNADILEVRRQVLEDILQNYTEEGALLPFKNAPYLGGGQLDFYIFMLPEGISFVSVDKAMEISEKGYGCDFGYISEVYRHWPWIRGRAAICYTHEGRHTQAMDQIEKLMQGATSLGALPEKIRLDGMPVNYWYTSPHALVVWTLHDAFTHIKGDELRIAYGFTDKWQNFSCEDICLEKGLRVSFSIEEGILKKLLIINTTEQQFHLKLKLNGCFSADLPEVCFLQSKGTFLYEI